MSNPAVLDLIAKFVLWPLISTTILVYYLIYSRRNLLKLRHFNHKPQDWRESKVSSTIENTTMIF